LLWGWGMGKQAKFTEPVSVLVTKETDIRLDILAGRERISRSDLVRRILDGYVSEHVEEIPTKQVATANIKYTLNTMESKLLARADESDQKAVNRDGSFRSKLIEALTGLQGELKEIRRVLTIMKQRGDDVWHVYYQEPPDDRSNK
jgi:hypothetical protein